MRFREDKPGDLDGTRAAVARWRAQSPVGTREQMLTALSPQFHRDYGPVPGAVLPVHDRDRARRITAHPAASGAGPSRSETTGRASVPARPGPGDNMTSTAAPALTRYQRTFHGRADQVRQVRADITQYLGDCPATCDAVLIASELAANAVVHSASTGEFFTVRCERHTGYIWIEVEDLGGPWRALVALDHPHGLYIVDLLTGPGNWGTETTTDGDRIVWARLDLPTAGEGT